MSAFDLDVLARIQVAAAEYVKRGPMWTDPIAQAMYVGALLQSEAKHIARLADRGDPVDEHLVHIAAIAIASLESSSRAVSPAIPGR